MPIDFGALVVIFLYLCCLAVVLFVSPRLSPAEKPVPFWRNVRLWASLVAVVQIVVYTLWG